MCGIIRPIAALDDYSAEHWSDVHTIIADAIDQAGFETRLVSDADAMGVIQGRIVKNLYDDDLVVCDVSGKNPNVMFELGMRLAFDKPTIVIKDDLTSYSFDTSPIEHLGYPRDLRFNQIIEFKERLARKATATFNAPTDDPHYKSFLQHFGPIKVPSMAREEVPADQFLLSEMQEMKMALSRLSNAVLHSGSSGIPWNTGGTRNRDFVVSGLRPDQIEEIERLGVQISGIRNVSHSSLRGDTIMKFRFDPHDGVSRDDAEQELHRLIGDIVNRDGGKHEPTA